MEKIFLKAYNFMGIVGAILCIAGIIIGLLNGITSDVYYVVALFACVLLIILSYIVTIFLKRKGEDNTNSLVIIRGHLNIFFGASSLLFALMFNQGKSIMQSLSFTLVIGIFIIVMMTFMLKAFSKLFANTED